MTHSVRCAIRLLPLLLILPCVATFGQSGVPRVFLMDPQRLIAVRDAYRADTAHPGAAVRKLLKEAGGMLSWEPVSVVEKTGVPPSGDKHDYMSIAPYWWPDPTKPDGLPYIRRDGEVNPDRYRVGDRERVRKLIEAVPTLALASYITGQQAYGSHAVRFLRNWFLDPATRMNPNLEYAQSVRGQNEGRGAGIIDTYGFRDVVDGIGILDACGAISADDLLELKEWFSRYLTWLLESKNGKEEARTKNNHGTVYAVQVSCIALFVGKEDVARARVLTCTDRIASQVEPDGSQPFELVRTKSWNYSMLNLEGLMQLAWLGERFGENAWSVVTKDGRSIRKAIDFLVPAARGEETWKHQQIARMEIERMYAVLRLAAANYGEKRYLQFARNLPDVHWQEDRSNILHADPFSSR